LQLLEKLKEDYPKLPIIIMTAYSDLESTVTAYQSGAFEYLAKPFDINEAVALAQRACEMNRASYQAIETDNTPAQRGSMIGESPAMQAVFRTIGRLVNSCVTVLITGETGTGKELIAKALHEHSPRAHKTLITLNTAAIPSELLESELFGHEKGAFTGAYARHKGHFEQADGGTLFLDEIGDMPAKLQTRLLRVLSAGEFYRVGGHISVNVNVRIIAATNQNLQQRVKEGLFREDLYHRLHVIRIHSPALRERPDDIPLLLNHFLSRAATELQMESKHFSAEVMTFLKALKWSGNVRQLENNCRWLMVMAAGRKILLDDLPDELRKNSVTESDKSSTQHWQIALEEWAKLQFAQGKQNLLKTSTPIFEQTLLQAALQKTNGRKQEAAKLLGWGRNTLTRKLSELTQMNLKQS